MGKIEAKEKVAYIEKYLSGKISVSCIAKLLNVSPPTIDQWISNYKSMGPEIFVKQNNNKYASELKVAAVEAYLNGEGSQQAICEKYSIRSKSRLQNWIMKYNGNEELKSKGSEGDIIMTKGRKTTFEERIEIVEYCITHERNYAETANKYQVSYQQVRNYVVKYRAKGIDGLLDKRGKRKTEEEMSEVERLRAENKLLKAEKEKADMEISFLKKLGEIERRWE